MLVASLSGGASCGVADMRGALVFSRFGVFPRELAPPSQRRRPGHDQWQVDTTSSGRSRALVGVSRESRASPKGHVVSGVPCPIRVPCYLRSSFALLLLTSARPIGPHRHGLVSDRIQRPTCRRPVGELGREQRHPNGVRHPSHAAVS